MLGVEILLMVYVNALGTGAANEKGQEKKQRLHDGVSGWIGLFCRLTLEQK